MTTLFSPENPQRTRNLALGGAVLLIALICCCCAVLAIVVVADPFGLDLIERLLGGPESTAKAMPADTGLYLGINVVNATPDKINRIIRPFAQVIKEETGSETSDDLLKEVDKDLEEELGVTIADDVIPWIGQYIGVGVLDLQFDRYGEIEDARFILAVEARDKKMADAFLTKLQNGIAAASGQRFITSQYQGVELYVLDTNTAEQVAFCRSGSLVLFARNKVDLQVAIDAQNKDSLASSQAYKNMARLLPRERAVTLYVTREQAKEMLNTMQQAISYSLGPSFKFTDTLMGWNEAALSVAIVDAGLQVDTVITYDLAELSETQRQMLLSQGTAPRTDNLFPKDTLAYLVGQRLDLSWQTVRASLIEASSAADFDEAMEIFANQYGINPDKDLFPYLNGEFAVGVMPSIQGFMAQQNIDLGFLALAHTSDAGALKNTMDNLSASLIDSGMTLESETVGNESFYVYNDPFTDDPVLLYGVGKDHLILASSVELVNGLMNGQPSLAQSNAYRQVWSAFPSGTQPAMYVDIQGLLGIIREGLPSYELADFNEMARYVEPIRFIAAGVTPLQDNAVRSTLIIFIPSR